MINFIKLSIFVFFFNFLSLISYAESNIAYINLDKILSESNPAKSLFNQLKQIEKIELDALKLKEKKLKEEENKILSSQNLLSREEYNKNVNIFKKKISSYQKKKNDVIENLKKKRNKEVMRFLKQINPIIEAYMKKNSIDILIEKKNIFIAHSNYDITDDVIKNIDDNINDIIIEK
jgi:outer membrane protein